MSGGLRITARGSYGKLTPILSFVTNSGNEIPFEDVVGDEFRARKVAEFIGVPFEYNAPPSFGDAIKAVAEAISSAQQQPTPSNKEQFSAAQCALHSAHSCISLYP